MKKSIPEARKKQMQSEIGMLYHIPSCPHIGGKK
jgi:hypothetical protein